MMKSKTVKDIGRIWLSKVYLRTIDASYLRSLAADVLANSRALVRQKRLTFLSHVDIPEPCCENGSFSPRRIGRVLDQILGEILEKRRLQHPSL